MATASERSPILIRLGDDSGYVEATLIDGVTLREAVRADLLWEPFLRNWVRKATARGIPRSDWPEHLHWQWRRKARRLEQGACFVGIECDNRMQGLMIVLTKERGCRIEEQSGKPLAYVDYIAVAPWNHQLQQRKIGEEAVYRQVGQALMMVAIQISRDCGYRGRIGLHSLPQTESFYSARCGMVEMGLDTFSTLDGAYSLRYFEMTPDIADAFAGKRDEPPGTAAANPAERTSGSDFDRSGPADEVRS